MALGKFQECLSRWISRECRNSGDLGATWGICDKKVCSGHDNILLVDFLLWSYTKIIQGWVVCYLVEHLQHRWLMMDWVGKRSSEVEEIPLSRALPSNKSGRWEASFTNAASMSQIRIFPAHTQNETFSQPLSRNFHFSSK